MNNHYVALFDELDYPRAFTRPRPVAVKTFEMRNVLTNVPLA